MKNEPTRTLVAEYGGVEVGRIATNRPYTHALVVRCDEAAERDEAFATEAPPRIVRMFELWRNVAAAEPGDVARYFPGQRPRRLTRAEIEHSRRVVEAGFETFADGARRSRIDYFAILERQGRFRPHIHRWLTVAGAAGWRRRKDSLFRPGRAGKFDLFEIVAAIPVEDAATEATAVVVDYTNWRGERARRRIVPRGISFGANEWHPEPQWLLEALDLEKNAIRTFALKDVHGWERPASGSGG